MAGWLERFFRLARFFVSDNGAGWVLKMKGLGVWHRCLSGCLPVAVTWYTRDTESDPRKRAKCLIGAAFWDLRDGSVRLTSQYFSYGCMELHGIDCNPHRD